MDLCFSSEHLLHPILFSNNVFLSLPLNCQGGDFGCLAYHLGITIAQVLVPMGDQKNLRKMDTNMKQFKNDLMANTLHWQ